MKQVSEYIQTTPYKEYDISIASADASFRKYYRLTKDDKSFLLMDSSLEKESLIPFLNVTKRLKKAGVNVPEIYAKNLSLGYLILEDFGDTHLLSQLNAANFKTLYKQAIDEIITMQKAETAGLPLYDKAFLHFEMELMQEWFLEKKLGLTLTQTQLTLVEKSLENIANAVLEQPQNIFVHRDYHSRNIMLTSSNQLGIIDYQDAMNGALTYDLVSLLKDCYIAFKRNDIEELALYFRDKKDLSISDAEFLRWFDFMGLQRHIKVLGIFSRLHLRDGKDGYLKDIPLTRKYVIDTAKRYDETKELASFLEQHS
ncbi:phosphotransferase [Sulfurimonas sp.]|uniref:aminoglycoside phosphotransferase family protein n=1 Tax=Sulfurimonas sp. TaxID=2022749 RepID=UPI00261C2315|nr:phosphotransferase [Sulfurimonas sp.]